MTATEHVILVDENDNPIGTAEKLTAHRENLRHRAFSVFIIRNRRQPEILLQQRASTKYHSPNLWTNTCCSHPRPEEEIKIAALRRLHEEMNIKTKLHLIGKFHYTAQFENGLSENEIDYVFIGEGTNKNIKPNSDEVQAYRWITIPDLKKEMKEHPEQFTKWLEGALTLLETELTNSKIFIGHIR